MSYDLMVFRKEAAPNTRAEFMKWYDRQTKWTDEHSYDDPANTSIELRNWFMEMIQTFPAKNGPFASLNIITPNVSDYCIGKDLIYVAFSWSLAEQAYNKMLELAEKHGVGFFDVSSNKQKTMNVKNLVDLIVDKHRRDGIDVNAPATLSDIADFEKQIGFSLPRDFREFYLTCNGFGCNEDIFNMVPLHDICRYKKDYGDNWFYFSEYMIYSDMWGLRRTSTGQFEIFNGSYPEKTMTSSLTEFLQKFLIGNVFEKGGLYEWQDELGIK